MADIKSIQPHIVPDGKPNPNVIERLRELLEMAEKGELRSVAYAAWSSDGMLSVNWTSGMTNRDLVHGTSRLWFNAMSDDHQKSL